jgi:hypothetical protein
MNPSTPQRKIVAGGFAGAVSTIAVWALEQGTGISVPAEIALAINTVFVFGVQYFIPNGATSA